MFVFEGRVCVYSHRDKSTGAHADLAGVVALAQQLADGCGTEACDVVPPRA